MFLTTTKCAEPAPGGTAAAQPLELSGLLLPIPGGSHRWPGDPSSPSQGTDPSGHRGVEGRCVEGREESGQGHLRVRQRTAGQLTVCIGESPGEGG